MGRISTAAFAISLLGAVPTAAFAQATGVSDAVKDIVRKNGDGDPKSRSALEKLSTAGDLSATELLGEAYLGGLLGFPTNPTKACDYFEIAQGKRGDATHNLATCYFAGSGRVRNLERARSLYDTAMGLGFPKAKCALGNMLVDGLGGAVDVRKGIQLCRESAESGVADSQADYGTYLLMGDRVPKDAIEARNWLTKAAEQKHSNAAFLLGQIYWNGDGVVADKARAAHWWKVAHEGGRPDAAWLIALEILERAKKPDKPLDLSLVPEARHWLELAAKHDPQEAKRTRARDLLSALASLK